MAYTYSKTDWISTDAFNVTDWQRIKANYEALLASCLYYELVPADFSPTITQLASTLSLPLYTVINTLESFIQELYEALTLTVTPYRESETWYARTSVSYIRNPTYDDWIRWEEFADNLNAIISRIGSDFKYSGEFYAGEV